MIDKVKFIDKKTIVILIFLLIILIYGYIYAVKDLASSYNDKTTQIETLKTNIELVKAQVTAKKDSIMNNRRQNLPVNIFEPELFGIDESSGMAYLLDSLLKKVKESKNKVIEISFASNNSSESQNSSSEDSTALNKQITKFLIDPSKHSPESSSDSKKEEENSLPLNKTTVKLSLVSTYGSIQELIEKIYTWKYLVGIKTIKIEDNNNDGGNLYAEVEIDLYTKLQTSPNK